METPAETQSRLQVQSWIDEQVTKPEPRCPQPVMLPIAGRKLSTCQLARDYTATSNGITFTIPAGFISDLASIPWFAWLLGFLPFGLHNAGSVPHDWLYALQGQGYDWLLSRAECDAIFLDLMLRAGVSPTRARIMHRAVRLCGWLPWSNTNGPVIEPPHYEIT